MARPRSAPHGRQALTCVYAVPLFVPSFCPTRALPCHEQEPVAAGAVPRPFPHQQRCLHCHQWPGGPAAGALWLDGHAAGDGLRGGRGAVHPVGGAHAVALGAQGVVPDRAGRGRGIGRAVCLGGVQRQLLAAVHGHCGGGLLQRQRWPVPLCGRRAGPTGLPREGRVAGAGRWPAGCRGRPQPGQRHAHLVPGAVCGRVHRTDRRGAVVHAVHGSHPVRSATRGAQRCGPTRAGAPPFCTDAPARLHRGHCGRGAGLWRDEPADGGHAAGHAGVWL
ncbi:hypothetical protein D3C71_1410390 [compost metagenome]